MSLVAYKILDKWISGHLVLRNKPPSHKNDQNRPQCKDVDDKYLIQASLSEIENKNKELNVEI